LALGTASLEGVVLFLEAARAAFLGTVVAGADILFVCNEVIGSVRIERFYILINWREPVVI
jgi:hypothetical protein